MQETQNHAADGVLYSYNTWSEKKAKQVQHIVWGLIPHATKFTASTRVINERKKLEKRFNPFDFHRLLVMQPYLKSVFQLDIWHDTSMRICISICPARCYIASATMWKGLTQGLTPSATDGVFSNPSCSAHAHAHRYARKRNIWNVTFFLGGMAVKGVL